MEIEYCAVSGYFVYFCLSHALYAFPLPYFLKIPKNSLDTVDTLKNSHRGRTWYAFLDIGSRNRHVVGSVIKLVSAAYWSASICFFYGYVRAFAWSASLWTRRVNVSRFLLKNDGLHWTVARIEIVEIAGRRAVSRLPIQIHRLSPRKWQENRRYRHRLWYLETWAPTVRKFYYEELRVKEQRQNGEWKNGMEKRGKLRGNDKINIFCYARRRYRLCYVAIFALLVPL